MNRRELLLGTAASAGLALAPQLTQAQAAPVRIVFWNAMAGALGEELKRVCEAFNAAQSAALVEPVFKGTYPETMTAAIAAFRAGKAPHLVQMYEVGTGSMLAAGAAVKQVWQLEQDTGIRLDPAIYMPAVRGYYSLADGRMASMPFNSSTPIMWYNKKVFERAGLDPERPPETWEQVASAAEAIRSKGAAKVAVTTAWPSWVHLECFGAIHDVPFATRANGFEGLDAELVFNGPPIRSHISRLIDMAKAGTFTYAGRGAAGDSLFPAGDTGISFNSSGFRAAVVRDARFRFGTAMLPFDPAIKATPNNSIIGGASLWTMTAPDRTAAEYKAVASFLAFLARPDTDALWHQRTGYVPVTLGGAGLSLAQGYYARNPGADMPIRQLNRGEVTANSKGLRLGRLTEIRAIIEEEFETALQGKQDAATALDAAAARGNKVLREFEKSVSH